MIFSRILKWVLERYFDVKSKSIRVSLFDFSIRIEGFQSNQIFDINESCRIVCCEAERVEIRRKQGHFGCLQATVSCPVISCIVDQNSNSRLKFEYGASSPPFYAYFVSIITPYVCKPIDAIDVQFKDATIQLVNEKKRFHIESGWFYFSLLIKRQKFKFCNVRMGIKDEEYLLSTSEISFSSSEEDFSAFIQNVKFSYLKGGMVNMPSIHLLVTRKSLFFNIRNLSLELFNLHNILDKSKLIIAYCTEHYDMHKFGRRLLFLVQFTKFKHAGSTMIARNFVASNNADGFFCHCKEAFYQSNVLQNALFVHRMSHLRKPPMCYVEELHLSKNMASTASHELSKAFHQLIGRAAQKVNFYNVNYKLKHLHILE